tara:strand:- start:3609 stop:4577 length:969 start_codon:yes stop_codon:yes gene_type:complete
MAVPISQPTPIQAKPALGIVPKSPVLRSPNKSVRIIDPEEDSFAPIVNIGLMGLPGTGKTKFLADLVEAGAKVFSINTDPGGCGEETILAQCVKNGTLDKFKTNFRGIAISDHDTIAEFFENPAKFYPKIWDFSPDFFAWEGFANFQQVHVSEKVSELYTESIESAKAANPNTKKEESSSVSEGFKFEQQQWGMIRNGTIRRSEEFLQLKNPSGKAIHHILTIHEGVESIQMKDANGQPKSEEKASSRPALQGAAKNFIGAGFAVVLRLTKEGNKYLYENSSKTLGFTKNRGIDLPEGKFPASAMELVRMIESAYATVLFTR